MTAFTFWKGVYSNEELSEYVNKTGDCPECEMFQRKEKGDNDLIKRFGIIAEENTDDDLAKEIPETLKDALNLNPIEQRLEYLRKQIEQENISYGEIAELQGLKEHIDKGDVLLLEWASVPEEEGMEKCPNCKRLVKDTKIYTTHEDNEHPDNKTYCEECRDK